MRWNSCGKFTVITVVCVCQHACWVVNCGQSGAHLLSLRLKKEVIKRHIAETCYRVAERFVPYAELDICGEPYRVPLRWRKWWFKENESETMEFVRSRCMPGMTFLDIGAHFGIYSVAAARRVAPTGNVISFEPCSRTREVFKRVICANKVTNVELREEAVCDSTGIGRFFTSSIPGDPANTLTPFEGHPNQSTIRTLRLDDLDVPQCDVIKIDAEGAEIRILQGARVFLRKHRSEIFLSVHPRQIRCAGESLDKLWNEFTGLGFVAYQRQCAITPEWFRAQNEWFDITLVGSN